jgi:hypothetical protein
MPPLVRFSVAATLLLLSLLTAACFGTAAPRAGHHDVAGFVLGTLVAGSSVIGTPPVRHGVFEVSSPTGGVYRITTNSYGQFRFRGRPGIYYPTIIEFGSRTNLKPFRVAAGRTMHLVLYTNPTAWSAASSS